MRSLALILLGALTFASAASAQDRGNIFFGYSYDDAQSYLHHSNLKGWEATAEGKITRFVAIVADVDAHYGVESYPGFCTFKNPRCTMTSSTTRHDYSIGPRLFASLGKIRPFAEIMEGWSKTKAVNSQSDSSFVTTAGLGLDYNFYHAFAWRVQADYMHTNFFKMTQHDIRASTGIVLRF
jgi:Outer membrane protein beta-barrel domain